MRVCVILHFDAAHRLPRYERCSELHGHTYKLEVVVEGEVKEDGMVVSFEELRRIVEEEVLRRVDHSNLNELLENPTVENLAAWIFERLKRALPGLVSVKLWEGRDKWAELVVSSASKRIFSGESRGD